MEEGKTEILYKDISYEVIGVLYDVHNELGGQMKEKHYQKAVEKGLEKKYKICKSGKGAYILFWGENWILQT